MTINDRIRHLSEKDRKLLLIAFEQQQSQYVVFNIDEFIGVNLTPLPQLEIWESVGVWSYGRIKRQITV